MATFKEPQSHCGSWLETYNINIVILSTENVEEFGMKLRTTNGNDSNKMCTGKTKMKLFNRILCDRCKCCCICEININLMFMCTEWRHIFLKKHSFYSCGSLGELSKLIHTFQYLVCCLSVFLLGSFSLFSLFDGFGCIRHQ